VASLAVLPGATVDLEIAGGDGPYRVDTTDGSELRWTATTWSWRVPDVPGLATLTVRDARGGKSARLNVFVMVPFTDVRTAA
jgi:hypothetical protein